MKQSKKKVKKCLHFADVSTFLPKFRQNFLKFSYFCISIKKISTKAFSFRFSVSERQGVSLFLHNLITRRKCVRKWRDKSSNSESHDYEQKTFHWKEDIQSVVTFCVIFQATMSSWHLRRMLNAQQSLCDFNPNRSFLFTFVKRS